MKRSAARRHHLVEPLEARIAPAANAWIGGASGNWNTPGNWSDGVPTADDVVTINPAGTLTITINSGAQVAASISMPGDDVLAISGGSLTLTAASTLHDLSLGGSGSLIANAAVSLTGSASFSGSGVLGGNSVVTSNGTLAISGGEPNVETELQVVGSVTHGNAFLDLNGAAAELRVLSGAVYESVNTASGFGLRALGGPMGFFVETGGVFRHASPNGATFEVAATVPFNVNGGTLQNIGVTGTALNLGGIGTFTNAILSPSANTTINFAGNNNTIVGTITGSGAGVVNLAGGQLHATAAGATLNFPAGLFNFSGSGILSGPGVFTNTGTIQISSGEPDVATELVNAGTIKHGNAFLDLDGAAGKLRVVSGSLYESVNTASGFGLRALGGTTGFFVEAGGVFRHASSNGASFEVAATVPFNVNGGTLQNIGVTGTALNLGGIGTFTNAILSPSANTTINFAGNNNTIVGTITGSGAGVVNLAGGQLNATAAGATLNFPAGLFNFSGSGILSGPGVFTNTGTIQITGGEPNLTTELVNAGTIKHGNAFLDLDGAAGKLRVVSGGLYESVNTASGFGLRALGGTTGFFVEAGGVFRHASSNGASFEVAATVPFNVNGGTLQNIGVTGTALNLGGIGTFTNAILSPSANTTINFAGNNNTIVGTITGSGAGVVNLAGGQLHATAAGATLNFPAGLFNVSGTGTLSGPGVFTNTGTIQITSGEPNLATELRNSGTITHGNAHLDLDGPAAKLRVLPGGVYASVNTASGFGFRALNSPAGVIVEAGGTLRHNSSNSAQFIVAADVPFNVTGGMIDAVRGDLLLNGTGVLTGATLNATAGGSISFGGSGMSVSGPISGAGSGSVVLGSGTLGVAASGASFSFATGLFKWGGSGTLAGPGVLTNVGAIQITGGEPNLTTELRNTGTITHGNAFLDLDGAAARLRIAEGGVYESVNTSTGFGFRPINSPAGVLIESGGTLRHNSPNGAQFPLGGVALDNRGTVEVARGTLTLDGPLAQVSGGVLTASTWKAGVSGTLSFTGAGITRIGAGTTVSASGGVLTGLGALTNNSGTLSLLGGSDLAVTGSFTNNGALTLSAGSVLTIPGTFTQTNLGSTEFQVGGTTVATIGRLAVTGAASLAGTGKVQVVNSFVPQAGQTFTLANYASKTGDFTTFNGLSLGRAPLFEKTAGATSLTLNSLVNAANLTTQTVATPANTIAGQDIALSYTVRNVSANATLATTWTDTVYLSRDGVLDSGDLVLTRVTHIGALAGNTSYTENLTVPLPGTLPDDYRILVLADSQGRVPDPDRAGNLAASAGTFALDVPLLTAGTPFTGTIRSGQDLYFRVVLPEGQTPSFTLTSTAGSVAEVYESFGAVPTRGDFDGSAFTLGSTTQRILGPATVAGTYYVLLHGREAAGVGQNFSFTANGLGFDVLGLDVNRGANIGKVTTTLDGAQFSPATTFTLKTGATTRAATAVYFVDANTAQATFDLTGLAAGSYDIVATKGVQTDTLAGAFTVTSGGTAGTLQFNVSSPRYVRPPFAGTAVTISYQNIGETDLDAPVFNLVAENALLRLANEPGFLAGTFTQASGKPLGFFELLGVSGGLAGVLSPGEKGTIEVIFQPIDSSDRAFSKFEVFVAGNNSDPINFESIKADVKPVGVSDEAWNAVFANFKAAAGTTVGSYHAMLVDNANYLGQFGKVSPSVTKLVDFELDQAGVLGGIADRYELGAYGRGGASPFADRLTVSASGDVTITDGNNERIFTKTAAGLFAGTGLDFGKLTKSAAGVFTLDGGSGVSTTFRASDGRIDFVQDANGGRVTTAWNASGQLTSVTDSLTGDVALFTYNAQGRIATDTDAVGRVKTFSYDASGERLTSVVTVQGTTTYTYVTGQGAAREHALASTTGPDGVTTTYSYDAQGRLTQSSTGTGPQAVTLSFAYDSAGKITTTDSAGNVTQSFYVAQGAVARSIDALGQTISVAYDALGRVTSVTDPSGVKSSASIGGAGLSYSVTDAARAKTQIEVGGDIRRLLSVTDSGGDITKFNYDAKGNLLETLYPEGFASRNEYNAAGLIVATTDANGARTTFAYNTKGLVTLRTEADGGTVNYAYDAHRNLLTATDGEGTTTLTYDAADRLLTIAYPNGKTITNTYDAAGRRATVADQTGYTVKYSYDALGRIDGVRDTNDARIVDYDYNALGQLTTETRGNDSTSAYTYDALGRTSTITHRDAVSAVTGFFNYTYDVQDRVKTVTDGTGTTTYTYDTAGRLSGVALPGGRTVSYGYDAEGNRVSVVDSVSGTANYTTNNADQYTTAGGETLTYDNAGRVVASAVGGVTTGYSYDAGGRLSGITTPGSVITFDYDALGNRIGKTENGVRTDFANDPAGLGTVFGEYQGASTTAHFASGRGVAARTDGAGVSAFYHYDATGNTALLSGAAGASIASYKYLPFGEITAQTGTIVQPFTFNGAFGVQDEAGDLYSMRARDYDAGLGRFTSRDPLGFSGGDSNLYSFVANDPVNQVDPSGLIPGSSLVTLPALPGGLPLQFTIPTVPALPGGLSLPFGANTGALPAGATVTELGVQGEALYLPAVKLAGGDKSGLLIKGSDAAIEAFGSPVAKASLKLNKVLAPLAPVAKFLNKIVPPPVQVLLAAKDVYEIEKSAYDYYKDAGEYGKFNPDEGKFSPDYYKNNADNWLLNQLIKDGIIAGKSKPEATLDAIVFLKKLNNDYIRDGGNKNGGPSTTDTQTVRPRDPNNIVGPAGAGADPVPDIIAPGQFRFDGFVSGTNEFGYRIEFENQPTASAPAQVVKVTQPLAQPLDSDLDFSTFAFTSFGFGAFKIDVPAGAIGTSFETTFDATATLGVLVKINAELNTLNGVLEVTFTSLDPATNEVPVDPFAGFLPANDASGRGDGFINYTIAPKAGLANATVFTSFASIVFDTEDPIATPTVTNTLDSIIPTSTVNALPATTTRSTFAVRWTAADNVDGSGIDGVTLYFTDNNGPLQIATVSESGGGFRFEGEVGHTYAFYSQAIDNVGNTEAVAGTPDASITVVAPTLITATGNKATLTDTDGDIYTVKLTGPGTLQYATVDPDGAGPLNGPLDFVVLDGTTAKSNLSVTVKRKGDGPDPDKLPDGDGIVTIGDVTITGALGSFAAKASDFVVNGLTASGAVKSIAVRDLLQPDSIAADPLIQTGAAVKNQLAISARNLADGFRISTTGDLGAIKAASIGEGSINGAALKSLTTTVGGFDANLTVTGAAGAIKVKTGADAGTWTAATFGAIKLGGAFEADLTASSNTAGVTSLTVTGGGVSGALTARNFGAISVSGGDFSGTIDSTATAAALGKTLALTKFTIAGGSLTGDVSVLGNVGAVSVAENKTGVGGTLSGELAGRIFGATKVTGGDFSGRITSTAPALELGKTAALASLSILGGNLTGDVNVLGNLGAVSVKADRALTGGSVTGATVTAARIASILVGLDASQSFILAGASLGADRAFGGVGVNADAFAAGSIGAVTVGRNATAFVLAAGLSSVNGQLNDAEDTILGGTASAIASLIIKGTADLDSYFAAGKFTGKPSIDKVVIADATADSRFKVG